MDTAFHTAVIGRLARVAPQHKALEIQMACHHVFGQMDAVNTELVVKVAWELLQIGAHRHASDILAAAIFKSPYVLILWRLAMLIELNAGKVRSQYRSPGALSRGSTMRN